MREVFISTPSFLIEANFNASAMQFGRDNDGSHNIRVVSLVGMDWDSERSIFTSLKSGRCCCCQ